MAGTVRFFALILVACRILLIDASFQPALVLDMAEILLENYCFPENLVGMQEAIQQAISSGEILHISDRKTLAGVLTAGVQGALNDPRLTVSYEPNYTPITPPALQSLPTEQLIRLIRNTVKLEVMDNNVGYLRIDRIIGQETVAKLGRLLHNNIWKKVAHTSAMIFDLRFSTAGEISGVPYIVSYFSDSEPLLHIDTIYERPTNTTMALWTIPNLLGERYGKRKELIVLISKRTMGAAEAVAYILKHLKRAIIVGERSAGGSVKVEKLRVGDSGFYITVPVARSVNPVTGQSWEVTGVSPSVIPDAIVLAEDAVERAHEIIAFHKDILALVQEAGDLLEKHYTVPEVAAKVSRLLQSKLTEGLYRSVVDYESLASQLTADLQETSGDHRLHIFNCDIEPESLHNIPKIPSPEEVGFIIDTLFKVEVLSGNIGYLRFDMMEDIKVLGAIGPQLIKVVWNKLVNTDMLIIDMRYNTGGYSTAIPLLCTYFFDAQPLKHLYTIFEHSKTNVTKVMTLPEVLGQRYGSQKDIYILTSNITGSAAEAFTRTMKDLKRATVIGEPTIGGALSSGTYQIGNSILYASIPNQAVLSAVTGKAWSVYGVEPHIAAQASDALNVGQKIISAKRQKKKIREIVL
uniref:Retinol-binding protein 3-like n=1 Tax=Sinocyclocheilus rhinocerous TaxID=307959 RepID=A0A673GQT7_9TELE